MTITINDLNEAPTMTGGATIVSHDENTVIDYGGWQLHGDGP